uniref:Uncharacterized protein n=1 Tax=Byssovorax cruenta TaxID=293647 RepID=A0A3S7UZA8_9BACT|nr:hypothetical protein [Byssovorax cruenta]
MAEQEDDLPLRDEVPPTERKVPPAEGSSPGKHGAPADSEKTDGDRKRLFERAIPEILKRVVERAVESGATRLAEGPESLRHFVQDMKLPKEVLHYLYTQIDDTKNGLYRVVAKEIRDVLEHTKFADELTAALTKLSFEIKTEIRFIPNDTAVSAKRDREPGAGKDGDDEGEAGPRLPKPEVTSQISVKDRSVKDRSKDARRERRGREDT